MCLLCAALQVSSNVDGLIHTVGFWHGTIGLPQDCCCNCSCCISSDSARVSGQTQAAIHPVVASENCNGARRVSPALTRLSCNEQVFQSM